MLETTTTNGRIIATSEVYDSKAAALKGLAAVQRLAAGATVVDRTNGPAPTKKGTSTRGATKESSAKNAAKRPSTKAPAVVAT